MDIMDEIDETIREKKSKWNYTPMRETSETDAIIDQLLREFAPRDSASSGSRTKSTAPQRQTTAARQTAVAVKPAAAPKTPAPAAPPERKTVSRDTYQSSPVAETATDKTMIFSRKAAVPENDHFHADSSDEYDESYEDNEDYGYDDNSDDVFDEFMDSEDDSDLEKHSSGIAKTVFKIIVTAIIAGFCITGILTTVNYFIDRATFGSRTGVSSSSDTDNTDEIKQVIYPAVAVDVDDFDDVSQLSSEQLVNVAVWEVVINGDMNIFKDDDTGEIILPQSQMEYIIEKLFGSDCEFEDVTSGVDDTVILYDPSVKGYIIPNDTDIYSYVPEIADISQAETDTYSVLVDYYRDTPSWTNMSSEQPVKRKMYTIKKTDEYYNIISVKTVQ